MARMTPSCSSVCVSVCFACSICNTSSLSLSLCSFSILFCSRASCLRRFRSRNCSIPKIRISLPSCRRGSFSLSAAASRSSADRDNRSLRNRAAMSATCGAAYPRAARSSSNSATATSTRRSASCAASAAGARALARPCPCPLPRPRPRPSDGAAGRRRTVARFVCTYPLVPVPRTVDSPIPLYIAG